MRNTNRIPRGDGMTLVITIPGATRTFPAKLLSGICLRTGADPTVATQVGTLRLAPLSLGEAAIMPVGSWRSLASREMSDGEFRSFPFSEFDTRLYSGTGSGHIRRPAALGLLLRYAPFTGSGSSQNKFAQTAQNAERISFGPLRKSRPSALGSRAHSRGFAMCAPSKSGAQNGEQTCI